jgi:uncharacterized protein
MALNPEQLHHLLGCLIEETGLGRGQVENTVALLGDGATVPFIARSEPESSTRFRSATWPNGSIITAS